MPLYRDGFEQLPYRFHAVTPSASKNAVGNFFRNTAEYIGISASLRFFHEIASHLAKLYLFLCKIIFAIINTSFPDRPEDQYQNNSGDRESSKCKLCVNSA